ncbi:hypothetical protein C2E20_0687 [Micractinium conductrix]|uniref:Uncharacterized protein n=1 Tax=Micractinium conductrix TaxID=554055 RepID=A0A2P6VQ93_9CHLO|nr:hypothetical protein C2E20_0687 [Micractinium conductrix]|eukprot:PSC76273.1 hypothetical protein C2E20_0687 [Micractinium conductrix]
MARGFSLAGLCLVLAALARAAEANEGTATPRRSLLQRPSGIALPSSGGPSPPAASPPSSPAASPPPPSPPATNVTAIPEDARLTTFLGSGGIAAPCQKWDTAGNDWTAAGTRFDASGSTEPSASAVSQLVSAICNDTRSGARDLLRGIEAGGSQAQVAVAAYDQARNDCADAASEAYGFAADAVNTGSPTDLPAMTEFIQKWVQAADAIGVPAASARKLLQRPTTLGDDGVAGGGAGGGGGGADGGTSTVTPTNGTTGSGGGDGGSPARTAGTGADGFTQPVNITRPATNGTAPANGTAPGNGTQTTGAGALPADLPSGAELVSYLSFGGLVASCRKFDPEVEEWVRDPASPKYDAAGDTQPPTGAVTNFTDTVCNEPRDAAKQLLSAFEAGGSQAQVAVYALLNADCADADAVSLAYGYANEAINSGSPDDYPSLKAWFQNMVTAADATGLPVCISLAVYDPDDGKKNGGIGRSQSVRHLLQATGTGADGQTGGAGGQGAGTGAPAGTSGTGGGGGGKTPATASLYTSISAGEQKVTCDVWDEGVGGWDMPRTAQEWTAKGTRQPKASDISQFTKQICDDPRGAGKALLDAVKAGGQQAENWVFALFNADCPQEEAAAMTYQYAIDAVNTGDPADLQPTKTWFTSLVKAADAVGIPLCASVALVDESDGSLIEQTPFHTG